MLFHVLIAHPFLLLFHCVYITVSISIHLLLDMWIISSFVLLQIKLLETAMYKSLYGHMLYFLWGK